MRRQPKVFDMFSSINIEYTHGRSDIFFIFQAPHQPLIYAHTVAIL